MDKIEVLLIPFGDNAVIIPKEIVEYILPYAPPLPFHNAHEAVIGSLIYQSERAPVIDLSKYDQHATSGYKSHHLFRLQHYQDVDCGVPPHWWRFFKFNGAQN